LGVVKPIRVENPWTFPSFILHGASFLKAAVIGLLTALGMETTNGRQCPLEDGKTPFTSSIWTRGSDFLPWYFSTLECFHSVGAEMAKGPDCGQRSHSTGQIGREASMEQKRFNFEKNESPCRNYYAAPGRPLLVHA